ncbi:MAG TPA: peptidylprolyl isomerase [Gammaproteobacteria bacterium]|nr:peptidylprolyl isomerase [Gammaproteobacteria bacterium]MEC8011681.1 FKBP-type peptidyl-prolyl cis-trans isomerase [Pseudomonadota bacterium]HCK92474.1 peptidylprolyl isomerase [Gammaproteobacteria bacterium]|tara:strand:- start:81 stop:560 length:480 start_codon:yes stop_codon:yes gene_type:complete
MLAIGPNTEITMHFSLALATGEVIDSTINAKPGTFNFGDETLPETFEKLLVGLKAGDRRSYLVNGDKGFGPRRDENIQRFKAEKLRPMADEPLANGLTILFEDASGQYISGVISNLPEGDVADDYLVTVDFNHPLAGRDLHFSVEIIDVKAVAQTVSIQ